MTDRLDAITALLALPCPCCLGKGVHENTAGELEPCNYGSWGSMLKWDDVRWLVDEVRRLRQRHAEAVEAAWKAGYELGHSDYDAGWPNRIEKAWLASEAKAKCQ